MESHNGPVRSAAQGRRLHEQAQPERAVSMRRRREKTREIVIVQVLTLFNLDAEGYLIYL